MTSPKPRLTPEQRLLARKLIRWVDKFTMEAEALLEGYPELREADREVVQSLEAAEEATLKVRRNLMTLLTGSQHQSG
jgi:hypothetical protein